MDERSALEVVLLAAERAAPFLRGKVVKLERAEWQFDVFTSFAGP